jgi:hypothetical protein
MVPAVDRGHCDNQRQRALDLAREHVRAALELCDAFGEWTAACHLQLGVDLIEASRLESQGRESREA